MNLRNRFVRELLEYASNNNYYVELRTDCAVIDGVHGEQVFITDGHPFDTDHSLIIGEAIFKGKFEDDCLITPEEFKRLFAKR